MGSISRRGFLATGALAAGALVTPGGLRAALAAPARAAAGPYGGLGSPDANGLQLPRGFRSREIARGLAQVGPENYLWPRFSDGQATFGTRDGGWILVTNAETIAVDGAGSSAIRFNRRGRITSAYRVLGETNINCAGGPTPWGTWLSCEEYEGGMVWECDPAGVLGARARPAMGLFSHEAAAVDPRGRRVYLTEDRPDGCFYRFTPESWPDLSAGRLEVAVVGPEGAVSWRAVPDPSAQSAPTRQQVAGSASFAGGEGLWHADGILLFTTKFDGKVWAFDARRSRLEVLFDRAASPGSSLDAVDNVTVSATGDVLVCEDGGNMEIGLIGPEGEVSPLLRFTGPVHVQSEVCGVVFDPYGKRLYCTSQGAYSPDGLTRGPGAVYEIRGPFDVPRAGLPDGFAYGPPTGERPGRGPLGSVPRGRIALRSPRRVARTRLLRRGLRVQLEATAAFTGTVTVTSADLLRRPGLGGSSVRPKPVVLARRRVRLAGPGEEEVKLRLGPRARRLLKARQGVAARVLVAGEDAAGRPVSAVRRLRIGRG